MKFTVTGKNIQITTGIKDYLTRKMKKIIGGLEDHADVHMFFAAEKHWHFVEVTIKTKGFSLNSKDETDDLYNAMDHALEKMKEQLDKQKGRIVSLKIKNRKAERKKFDTI